MLPTSDPSSPPHPLLILPGTLNQNNWAKKFPSCSSARQSPVDLQESLAQVRLQYQGLSFDGWEELSGGRTTAKNDGKTGETSYEAPHHLRDSGVSGERVPCYHYYQCNCFQEVKTQKPVSPGGSPTFNRHRHTQACVQ